MRWWFLLILVAGCAKSLEDIGEFKCPANGFCPAGYSCIAGTCKAPAIDGPCQFSTLEAHGDPCNRADASARCLIFDAHETKGICAKACSSGQCDAGHVCAKDPTTLDTYCLLDATAPCPPGSSPHPTLDVNGMSISVCVPAPPTEGADCWSSFACGLSDPRLVCTYGTCAQVVDEHGACQAQYGVVSETVEGFALNACLPTCSSAIPCSPGDTCISSLGVCVHTGSRGVGVGCDISTECASGLCLANTYSVDWHACSVTCPAGTCPAGFSCSVSTDGDVGANSCYLAGTDLSVGAPAN